MEWKGYDKNGNIIYELKNGNGKVKEYDIDNKTLRFEGEYLMEKEMEKEKNMIFLEFWFMKENFWMIKEMEKENNIINKVY